MAYESIGGGSPIVKYTQAQADGIKLALESRGIEDVKCYFAMRYWHPYTEEVLDLMQLDERNTLVIVPLYPQYSISTSGSSLKLLQEIFYAKSNVWGPDKVAHTVVPAWYYRPGYLKVMAKLIIKELEKYSLEEMQQGNE
jgi:ferrochelatase